MKKKNPFFPVICITNISGSSRLCFLTVYERKYIGCSKGLFSHFRSSEINVSSLALGTAIAMCLTCLLKELGKRFVKNPLRN